MKKKNYQNNNLNLENLNKINVPSLFHKIARKY